MTRQKRTWYPGAKYHITSRGVRRTNLFHDEVDREVYLSSIERTMKVYPFILHSYCLMTNHIHLQIQTIHSPIGMIMKYINTKYARYFNKKYHHSGHVFEKRYGAELIDSSEYELELSKYIHLNPLKANMVERLEVYPWSSYPVYINNKNSTIVTTTQILSYFPEPQSKHYEKYLKSGYTDLSVSADIKFIFNNEYNDEEEQW